MPGRNLLLLLLLVLLVHPATLVRAHALPMERTDMPRGKIAVVTGANEGIGYHIAQQIARSGDFATVILACRRVDAGSTAARDMTMGAPSSPTGCAVVEAMELDISAPASIARFASAFAIAHGDRLDVLVNNAAIASRATIPPPSADRAGRRSTRITTGRWDSRRRCYRTSSAAVPDRGW